MIVRLRAAVGLAVALLVVSAAGCSDIDRAGEYRELKEQLTAESQQIWEVLPVAAEEVARVVVLTEGRRVEVVRSPSGEWVPGEGGSAVTSSLMFDTERVLFPMLSYRKLTVDASEPAFGLAESELALSVETRAFGTWNLRFGAETFSGGGHYAQVEHDPHVYTVIPRVVDGLLSVALGEKVDRGIDPRFAKALNELMLVTTEEEDLNPWLAQVLEHDGR